MIFSDWGLGADADAVQTAGATHTSHEGLRSQSSGTDTLMKG